MTYKGIFEDEILIQKLKTRIKNLIAINKEHQQINWKLRSELSIEKKNHDLCREDNDLLNMEMGRMMKKLSEWTRY